MKVLFALAGLNRVSRGAETAFISIAGELIKLGDSVTLIGSGQPRPAEPYQFLRAACIGRERFETFPSIPFFRNECAYEELTFVPGLVRRFQPDEYDVTLTCSYPFTNWVLRRPIIGRRRPPHVFVTQNGDWPACSEDSEYKFFGCDGLVCTNPDFYERNRQRWFCSLIPNGVDYSFFQTGPVQRGAFGLPENRVLVLMVSALTPTKRIHEGIEAVHRLPNVHLVVAGDGPLRDAIDVRAAELLPGRFTRLSLPPREMPALYRCADVFLHMSKEEAFGNVYIEAMACGIPIVAHDSARLRWIIGNDEVLVDTSDLAGVAQAIVMAGRLPTILRERRIARAKTFLWNRIGVMYHDFLELVVERSKQVNG